MDSRQLVDSLAAHASLYHRKSHPVSCCGRAASGPRAAALRWFTSLSVPNRQAALTVFDPDFLSVLLGMLYRLRSDGHGFFMILPDIPDPLYSSVIPSLCFRRSRGLLARVSAAGVHEREVYNGVLLFGSKEGECEQECVLDSLTVAEDLVRDVNRFVEIMDGVSDGMFLREEVRIGSPWLELPWLKDKGFYSMESFLVNRIEIALRASWVNSNCLRKRKGGKVGEASAGNAGVASNAFWRKKGCLDWWTGLDHGSRKSVLSAFFGRSALSLVNDILKKSSVFRLKAGLPMRRDMSMSWKGAKYLAETIAHDHYLDAITATPGRSLSMNNGLKSLAVILEISIVLLQFQCNEIGSDDLFFSRLHVTDTISDFLLRKLRGRLLIISTESVKLELMGDPNLQNIPSNIEGNTSIRLSKGKKKGHKPKRQHSLAETSKNLGSSLPSPVSTSSIASPHSITSPMTVNRIPCAADACREAVQIREKVLLTGDGLQKGPVSKKKARKKKANTKFSAAKESGDVDNPRPVNEGDDILSTLLESEIKNSLGSTDVLINPPISEDIVDIHLQPPMETLPYCDSIEPVLIYDELASDCAKDICEENNFEGLPEFCSSLENLTINCNKVAEKPNESVATSRSSQATPSNVVDAPSKNVNYENFTSNFSGGTSYEWPSIASLHYPSVQWQSIPTATDRLHLDVGRKLPMAINCHQSSLPPRHQSRSSSVEYGHNGNLHSLTLPMSYDWPPMLKNYSRLAQTATTSYDPYTPMLHPSFCSGFSTHRMQVDSHSKGNDRKLPLDVIDIYESKIAVDFSDDNDGYWLSEEESDPHVICGNDYNQFFGGGVMYWNTSDGGTNFSRPPSYSSDDSFWAWHEAELNRTIDDMVGMPGLSYNTSGMASPPSGPFCSAFDPLGQGHQSVGYAMPSNDTSGKEITCLPSNSDFSDEKISNSKNNLASGVEGIKVDHLPYAMLQPIIIPRMSRKGSRSEFVPNDNKSPCISSGSRELPRIKRPPSPVVLCVPRVPRPPPPSPVGDWKKRGVPIVRSGSSSPRHWGLRNSSHGENNFEGCNLTLEGAEVVWPSWGSKGFSTNPMMQSIQGSLLPEHLVPFSHLSFDQEHPDVALPLQASDLLNLTDKTSLTLMHNILHGEIDFFWKQVVAENLGKKPYINWAVKRVTRSLQVLWPRSRTNIFGSCATGLALPTSDVDLVVSLPPVRNLEPIKEAGILEGRNGIKETSLQHAARYLGNQEWVRNDSLKTIENAAIPLIMLVAEVPHDAISSKTSSSIIDKSDQRSVKMPSEHGCVSHSDQYNSDCISCHMCSKWRVCNTEDAKSIYLDISFKSASHTGLRTSELVRELTKQFPATVPLALVLKQFLADRSLGHSYSGGISSYCLVLLITRFLQHEHHIGRQTNTNLGSLLMDFLYFFGNVFDPRQMRVSIQGSGVYMNRERGHSIDPIHIDDPLFPCNNVGRNCFRIHQCIKAFADAYSILESVVSLFSDNCVLPPAGSFSLLQRIIPSISPSHQSSG